MGRQGRIYEGAATSPPPPSSGNRSEKGKFCCAQTVKSNILLSQNAGNAITDTLDVHNVSGGMPPDPTSRARASPSDDRYAVDLPPPFPKSWIRPWQALQGREKFPFKCRHGMLRTIHMHFLKCFHKEKYEWLVQPNLPVIFIYAYFRAFLYLFCMY